MLTKVEVVTETGLILELPLEDPQEGYLIQDISGLDPVKATIVSSSFAQIDGSQYQASRRENRNIVIKLGLEPDFINTTVRALRTRLYGYFMPKSHVLLRFTIEGEGVVEIRGRVETFVSPLFVKEPDATISILCFDPDFYEPEPLVFAGNTNDTGDELLLNYKGSVDTGFLFEIYVDRPIAGFTINHRAGDDEFGSLEFTTPLQAGDVVQISTVVGNKFAYLTRTTGGVTYEGSILYGVSPHANWISLLPGDNFIRVYVEGLAIPYTIEYTHKYGGL